MQFYGLWLNTSNFIALKAMRLKVTKLLCILQKLQLKKKTWMFTMHHEKLCGHCIYYIWKRKPFCCIILQHLKLKLIATVSSHQWTTKRIKNWSQRRHQNIKTSSFEIHFKTAKRHLHILTYLSKYLCIKPWNNR